jgi:hypothetical protein
MIDDLVRARAAGVAPFEQRSSSTVNWFVRSGRADPGFVFDDDRRLDHIPFGSPAIEQRQSQRDSSPKGYFSSGLRGDWTRPSGCPWQRCSLNRGAWYREVPRDDMNLLLHEGY